MPGVLVRELSDSRSSLTFLVSIARYERHAFELPRARDKFFDAPFL